MDPASFGKEPNKIAAIDDPREREQFVAERVREYVATVDLLHLASDLVIDAIVPHAQVRGELIARFALARGKDRFFSERRRGNPPV